MASKSTRTSTLLTCEELNTILHYTTSSLTKFLLNVSFLGMLRIFLIFLLPLSSYSSLLAHNSSFSAETSRCHVEKSGLEKGVSGETFSRRALSSSSSTSSSSIPILVFPKNFNMLAIPHSLVISLFLKLIRFIFALWILIFS